MKPHPRIRKITKWGGAVAIVLLTAAWAWSGWHEAEWSPTPHYLWRLGAGQFTSYHTYGERRTAPGSGYFQISDFTHLQLFWDVDVDGPHWDRHGVWWTARCPLWMPLTVLLLPTALAFRLDTLARRRARFNLCPKCDYNRTGLPPTAPCPECGTPPKLTQTADQTRHG